MSGDYGNLKIDDLLMYASKEFIEKVAPSVPEYLAPVLAGSILLSIHDDDPDAEPSERNGYFIDLCREAARHNAHTEIANQAYLLIKEVNYLSYPRYL